MFTFSHMGISQGIVQKILYFLFVLYFLWSHNKKNELVYVNTGVNNNIKKWQWLACLF